MCKNHLFLFVFLFTISFSFGQKKFDKWWTEVENLELEGKSMSAYETAQKILKKADRKENSQQFLKAFLYVSKYKLILRDNSHQEVYEDFVKEIEQQTTPNRQVLSSFLAESLGNYKYRGRRNRVASDTIANEIATWNSSTIKEKSISLYKASLEDRENLSNISLKNYKDILSFGNIDSQSMPTLYDLLANRYIEYLNPISDYTNPFKTFYIQDSIFFSVPQDFVKIKLNPLQEDESNTLKVLKIYQDLTNLHLAKNNTLSVIMITLDRLSLIREKAKFENVNTLYVNALKRLERNYKKSNYGTWINLEIAKFYYQNVDKNNHKDYYLKALKEIEKILSKTPNTKQGVEALRIKNSILNPELTFETKEYIIPDKKFRTQIQFRNQDSVHVKVYKLDFDINTLPHKHKDSIAENYLSNQPKPFLSRSYSLPKVSNHLSYSTEILMDELPMGKYLIVYSPTKNPDYFLSEHHYQYIQATKIVYTSFDFDQTQQILVTDRETGFPLEGVKIELNESIDQKTYTTNQQGITNLKNHSFSNKDTSRDIKIIFQKDTINSEVLFTTEQKRDNLIEPQIELSLFTDRSIYRPGQTIYFKGIAGYQNHKDRKVVPQLRLLVSLYDNNYDVVDSLKITTNDFGSVDGSFKIPSTIMTGYTELEIEIDEDYYDESEEKIIDNLTIDEIGYDSRGIDVRVEEYKRPKFEVKLHQLDKTYVINDSISVKGNAKAFFGGNITNAKVNYTIRRDANLSSKLWRIYRYSVPEIQIASGNTVTDQNGNFNIKFLATVDSIIQPRYFPTYDYEVEVTVTDINGETHSSQKSYTIGYHTTIVQLESLLDQIYIDKEQKLMIKASDLNGLPSKADGELKIYKYHIPDRITTLSESYPEIQQIPKKEFLKHFPYAMYDSLDSGLHRKKQLIKTISVEIDTAYAFSFDAYKEILLSGKYSFEFEGKDSLNRSLDT